MHNENTRNISVHKESRKVRESRHIETQQRGYRNQRRGRRNAVARGSYIILSRVSACNEEGGYVQKEREEYKAEHEGYGIHSHRKARSEGQDRAGMEMGEGSDWHRGVKHYWNW